MAKLGLGLGLGYPYGTVLYISFLKQQKRVRGVGASSMPPQHA